jgi:hypothetical protein
LRGTKFSDISIVPDLTRKQRSREAKMKEEAEERNKDLTAEERRRNVKWMVVGRRGEKRLIKGVERDQEQYGTETRNRARGNTNRFAEQSRNEQRDQQRDTVPRQNILPRIETSNRFEPLTRDERESGARSKDTAARRDERELGARSKTTGNRWQENSEARATDRPESSVRWTEVVHNQRRDCRQSKRTRGSGTTSEEDDHPRTRQRN